MDTVNNARAAAREILQHGTGIEDRAQAAAAYIRSLIRDGDIGYLCELVTEQSQQVILKRASLLAQALDTNRGTDHAALGAHECDAVWACLDDEISAVIDELRRAA